MAGNQPLVRPPSILTGSTNFDPSHQMASSVVCLATHQRATSAAATCHAVKPLLEATEEILTTGVATTGIFIWERGVIAHGFKRRMFPGGGQGQAPAGV